MPQHASMTLANRTATAAGGTLEMELDAFDGMRRLRIAAPGHPDLTIEVDARRNGTASDHSAYRQALRNWP